MKAHAKLNAVAKSMKYKMYNMIFDDLLDLSGIDTSKSSGYIHDATNGLIKSAGGDYVVETKEEIADTVPSKIIVTAEEERKSVSFNINSTSYATLPSGFNNFSNGITIEAWVYTSSLSDNWARILELGTGRNSNAILFNRNNNTNSLFFQIGYSGPAISSTSGIEIGKWQYFAATLNTSGQAKIYKGDLSGNLVEIASGTLPLPANVTRTQNRIGKGAVFNDAWNGAIAELRIWNTGKTKEELQSNMGYLLKGNETNLVHYWGFTEGNGSTAIDKVGAKHATLVSPSWNLTQFPPIKPKEPMGLYYVSRNNGVTFESISLDSLFYFNDNISPKDNKIRLKAELPANIQLLNYALTWA